MSDPQQLMLTTDAELRELADALAVGHKMTLNTYIQYVPRLIAEVLRLRAELRRLVVHGTLDIRFKPESELPPPPGT